jgi:hypothetical protein
MVVTCTILLLYVTLPMTSLMLAFPSHDELSSEVWAATDRRSSLLVCRKFGHDERALCDHDIVWSRGRNGKVRRCCPRLRPDGPRVCTYPSSKTANCIPYASNSTGKLLGIVASIRCGERSTKVKSDPMLRGSGVHQPNRYGQMFGPGHVVDVDAWAYVRAQNPQFSWIEPTRRDRSSKFQIPTDLCTCWFFYLLTFTHSKF